MSERKNFPGIFPPRPDDRWVIGSIKDELRDYRDNPIPVYRILLKERRKLRGYIDFLYLTEFQGQSIYYLAGLKTDASLGLERYPYDLASTDLVQTLQSEMEKLDACCLVDPINKGYFYEHNGWQDLRVKSGPQLQSYNAHGQPDEEFAKIVRDNASVIVGYRQGVLRQERQEREERKKRKAA